MYSFSFTMKFITILGDFCFWLSESRKWLGREILDYLHPNEEQKEQRVDVYFDGYHPDDPIDLDK